MMHGLSRLVALSTLLLACKATPPASTESSTGGSSTGSTGGASSTGDAVTTTSATDGVTTSTQTSGSTGGGSSGSTSGGETTGGTTGGVGTTGGGGTTIFPLPEPCPSDNTLCAPPAGDTDGGTSTGGGDPCFSVFSELETSADAMCDGAFHLNGIGYDANDQCCIFFSCTSPTPHSKACLPLASVRSCVPGAAEFWPLLDGACRTMLGYESVPLIDGDKCCVEFSCYCGETG